MPDRFDIDLPEITPLEILLPNAAYIGGYFFAQKYNGKDDDNYRMSFKPMTRQQQSDAFDSKDSVQLEPGKKFPLSISKYFHI